MKYIRDIRDGFVHNFNATLAQHPAMEVFESDSTPPDRINDLVAFLTGAPATRKVAMARGEGRRRITADQAVEDAKEKNADQE